MTRNSKSSSPGKTALHSHDTSHTLTDLDRVFSAFMESLKEGDAFSAAEILAASLSHLNKLQIGKNYRIPRRSLYNLLSRRNTPNLALVAKICNALTIELIPSGRDSHASSSPDSPARQLPRERRFPNLSGAIDSLEETEASIAKAAKPGCFYYPMVQGNA